MRPEMLLIAQEALRKDLAVRQDRQESSSSSRPGIGGHAANRTAPLLDVAWLSKRLCAGLAKVFGIGRALPPIDAAGTEASFSTGISAVVRSRTLERTSAPAG